jgi:hypothetical protein
MYHSPLLEKNSGSYTEVPSQLCNPNHKFIAILTSSQHRTLSGASLIAFHIFSKTCYL